MSKGYEEVRFGLDGRWQPTGQLRDQLPQELRPNDDPSAPVPSVIAGVDTSNVPRRIIMLPLEKLQIGALGWAQFSRKTGDQ